MILRDELNTLTPRLRRYARALATGSPLPSEHADDLVQATLMRAIGARYVGGMGDLAVRLFATVTQLHREGAIVGSSVAVAGGRPALVASGVAAPSGVGQQTKLSAGLLNLSLEEREALLLVTLEGFSYEEASRILRVSQSVLITRLTQARTALDQFMQARPARRPTSRPVPYLRLVT